MAFRIPMTLLWLLIGVCFRSVKCSGESSMSNQQGIANMSNEVATEDQDVAMDHSMEDLETFYEYLDDSEADFGEEDKSEKLPTDLSPDYDVGVEDSQQSSNVTSDECTTANDSTVVGTSNPATTKADKISVASTSEPKESKNWEDEKYLNLSLNPKIEISIEILHEEITARPRQTSSSMTPTDPYDKTPTIATDSPRISPTTTATRDLERLPFAIRALDKDLRPTENQDGSLSEVDVCERWLNCPGEKILSEMARLQDLPNCPCMYSFDIHYKDEIWDSEKKHNYRWRDASGPNDHLDIFHSGARWCIRSLISDGSSSSMAAQKCCYDHKRHLITRGNGAGTPYFISPEVSRELHHKVDVIPWIVCKGDWTRYHIRRSPNNGMHCRKNPSDNVYSKQIQKAKNYR